MRIRNYIYQQSQLFANLKKDWGGCKCYMLEMKEDSRDKWNYIKLERMYNIAQDLHLHQLYHKANVVQEFFLIRIVKPQEFEEKILVGFFWKTEEINQCKMTLPYF